MNKYTEVTILSRIKQRPSLVYTINTTDDYQRYVQGFPREIQKRERNIICSINKTEIFVFPTSTKSASSPQQFELLFEADTFSKGVVKNLYYKYSLPFFSFSEFLYSLVWISLAISSSSIPFFHKILSSEFNTATESHGNLVVVFRVCYSPSFGNRCAVFLFAGLTGAEVLSWIFTAAISLNSPDPLGVHSVFPLCVGIFSWQEGKELVGDIPFFFRGLMKLYCGSLTGWT